MVVRGPPAPKTNTRVAGVRPIPDVRAYGTGSSHAKRSLAISFRKRLEARSLGKPPYRLTQRNTVSSHRVSKRPREIHTAAYEDQSASRRLEIERVAHGI